MTATTETTTTAASGAVAGVSNNSIPPRHMTGTPGSVGNYACTVRWPGIIQNAVDVMTEEISKSKNNASKVSQGQIIKQGLIELRHELVDKMELRKFTQGEMDAAAVPSTFNEFLDEQSPRLNWGNTCWMFSSIYMYRRMNVLFRQQDEWAGFDIFNPLKQSSFKASYQGVAELAIRYMNLSPELKKLDKSRAKDQATLEALFNEFTELSLWGNASDLSQLSSTTLEDIASTQGNKARKASGSNILVNDTKEAFQYLMNLFGTRGDRDGNDIRVDFVLDNSGFELYADLMLAAFLLHTGLTSKCVFHAKDIPYMVSDVMVKDFGILIEDMRDREFYAAGGETTLESQSLDYFADDITTLNKAGRLTFETDPFWTTNLDYWNINQSEKKYGGARIYKELSMSDLVIFKGDLNYRKLTGDRIWEHTTPWTTAIGPMATNGIASLCLRTCKADVQVGLQPGQFEAISAAWQASHPEEQLAFRWHSTGKWAVIAFCSGQ